MADNGPLSQLLADFARTMATDFPIEAILDTLMERIVGILPVTAAGVALMSSGGGARCIASSGADARRYEELQRKMGEGPSFQAFRSGRAVAVPDLAADRLFPDFAVRAEQVGLAAIFSFPLQQGDYRPLGVLNLYRNTARALSDVAMDTAQTLADVAAAYLLNARARAAVQDTSDRSRHAALHDGLTGLPNRVLLLDRLRHASLRGHRTDRAPAVFFVNLDRFKRVNAQLGHTAGDELLVAVTSRLSRLLRAHDTMARLSADEFVIVCEDLDDLAEATAIGDRIINALREPFVVAGATTGITASLGIAFSDRSDSRPDNLLRDADIAMYHAKRDGGNRHHVFDRRQQRLDDQQASLEGDLLQALPLGQLYAEYQPIVKSAAGRVTGFEALLRWRHPTRGLVPPTTVVPLAEQSGLITSIGHWVLAQAWSDRSRWRGDGHELTMSVNVSAHQLMTAGFSNTVSTVLESNDSDPSKLTLEITESVFVQDSDRALAVLNELKQIGVLVALDDFGTGYSSLSYLRHFPVDIVKIDRSFVTELGHDFTSHAIVDAVVKLSHALGMTIVAEGVETLEQYREVSDLGCDSFQGYYFARPMPAASVDELLRHNGHPSLPVPAVA